MNTRSHPNIFATAKGFTIVELMVAVVIGMLAVLAIMQMFYSMEGQKRSMTSGGDAQTAGILALHAVEQDIRQAGYGLSALAEANALGCTIKAYNEDRAVQEFDFIATPLLINPANIPAGDPNTDIVMATYGSSDGLTQGVSFTQPSGSSANFKVSNPNAFRVGELVLAVPPDPTTSDCSVAEITGLPSSFNDCSGGGGGASDVIIHNSGTYKNPFENCVSTEAQWNKPSGIDGVAYPDGGTLFSLGPIPKTFVYAIRGGRLTVCDYLANDCTDEAHVANVAVWAPIGDNIVSLQAQYGKDTTEPFDSIVDAYNKTTPPDGSAKTLNCQWQRVQSARIALVARSNNAEKEVVTAAALNWAGGAIDLTKKPDNSVNTLWANYRYKLYETTIPLRNNIWIGIQTGC